MDRKNKFGFNFDLALALENEFRVSKGFARSKYRILRSNEYHILRINDVLVVRSKQKLLPIQSVYYVGFQ